MGCAAWGQQNYVGTKGTIAFKSDAPLELIQANSAVLRGAVNTDQRTFAFAVKIVSFQGFNSALQRTHFNQNYMESAKYEEANFKGKIIEEVDFSKNGTYNIRAKGTLLIHGVAQERIIRATCVVQGGTMAVSSSFSVPISDHKITIPRIVSQKIAENIDVKINITLKR
jgi:polyisoprenoid-binding protein YceI